MKFSKKVKSLLYGMEFTHGMRRAIMGALGLIYFLSFGFNIISVTTLFAVSTIVRALFEFPTGAIADYDSRKKSIMIGKKKSKIVSLISKGYFFEKGGHIIGGLIGLIIISLNFSFIWLFISISQIFMFFIVGIYMKEKNFKPEKVSHGYLKKSLIKAKESFNYIIHKKNKQLRTLMIGDFLGILGSGTFLLECHYYLYKYLI